MDIANRILKMESRPMFETRIKHGEFEFMSPDWDSKIEVKIQYYDGRISYAYVNDKEELEVFNLYLQRNREAWENDEQYD